jgi:hypothetical protein
MTEDEFRNFVDESYDALEVKQQLLQGKFDLGSYQRFDFDFESEEIRFKDDDDTKIKADIIPIGSFCTRTSTWMWGWANPAFPNSLRENSEKIKELYDYTGYEIFKDEITEIEEDMVWEISGMAIRALGSEGVYRSPQNETLYFYAINNVSRVN